ncbi:MAG: family 43 glycosylhydrolase [Bacteroidales bacterium]|jgi:arabinan endo-1,5-alpha-L-arabinosidase|nr:family 43 glycosylhydrolase [Bacteroidales bacterium]
MITVKHVPAAGGNIFARSAQPGRERRNRTAAPKNKSCRPASLFFFLLSVAFSGNCAGKQEAAPIDRENGRQYRNPVIGRSAPDPTVIRAENGIFYLYSTEDIRNVPIYKSSDLVEWQLTGTAFTAETRPRFEPRGGIWAPDINLINGKYVMYYSMSVWGGEWTCGIGVAVADSPEGHFTDMGMLFRSNTIGVQNSIDPFYIEDAGKKYLFWGSFSGIYGIELSDDGRRIREGASKQQIAGTAYEGAYIHQRGKYYYLFASVGTCCEGLKSTYTTVAGRSENLWGPYTDKQGGKMTDNRHETVIRKNEFFVGVGHNSEIVRDDNGDDWILYHGVNVSAPKGRCVLLDRIIWENDWPSVAGDSPSATAKAPVFGGN